jgi:hypothetical protein
VLAVVQDEKQLALREFVGQLGYPRPRTKTPARCRHHRGRQEPWRGEVRQHHQAHPVGERGPDLTCDVDCQAGLAHAAYPRQGDQAGV